MKRLLAVAAAATALTLTAACGSSDARSGSSASSSSSAKAAASVKVGDSVDLATVMAGSAEAVKEKKSAHMSMAMGSTGTAEADVDYGTPTAMKMTMKVSGQAMNMILLDKTIYMGGEMFASMSGGKKWIKVDPEGTDPLSKQMAPLLEQMDSLTANPASQFAALKGVKAKVTAADAGSTTYDVRLTKAQLEAQKNNSFPGLGDKAGSSFPDGIEYTITLDKDSLPVSTKTTVEGQVVTVTMSKWGEAVDISAPPAGEVGTLTMPSSGT